MSEAESDDALVWTDFALDIHRCHPSGAVGDTFKCPDCDKTWLAKPTILWQEMAR